MPKKIVRVKIPSNPSDQIVLLGRVKAKSDALAAAGGTSPLAGLKWTAVINPALAEAKTQDDQAETQRQAAERSYRARDQQMPAVTQALRDARDVLLGLNSDNPKAINEFGFEVDDTPPSKPKTAPKPPAPGQ